MTSPRTIAALAMLAVAISPASLVVYADSGPYTVQDAGPANAIARGVNATAVVAGTSADQAFRTAFGAGPEILPGLSTPDFAFGVHDEGWVVGSSGFQPVKFAPAAVALEPTPFFGEATAVNAAGDIAGYGFFSGVRAFVWLASGGGKEMPIAATSMAAAINDRRVVTGQVVTGVGQGAAFRWTVGESASALPTLGGTSAKGRGINNAGDIVGDSYRTSQVNDVAAWWKAGGDEVVDLGTLGGAKSSAADINNHGQIVGYAETASGARRAFLYENGVLVDLNTLLEPGSGWVLVSANAINDAGQIAGEGLFGDDPEPRAFLLTPVEATDTTPPVITAVRTTPSSIWPPRHQMVDVLVAVDASDDSGETPVCSITGVTSSEPENGSGDGDTAGDSEIVGALAARVRAERSGPVGSRVYTLAVECVDGSGNAASGKGIVVVGELSAAKTARAKK